MWSYFKYLWYILLFGFLIGIVTLYNRSSDDIRKQSLEYLQNNVEFEGVILGYQRSDNHSFGVIQLKITRSNVTEFNKTLEKGVYPYRIKGNIAELYCTVSIERKKGDSVKVISNNQTIYYNPSTSEEKVDIHIINDLYDINFIRKHTIF